MNNLNNLSNTGSNNIKKEVKHKNNIKDNNFDLNKNNDLRNLKSSINNRSSINNKFKNRNKALNPANLIKRIFLNFKLKKAYKQPAFWVTNIIMLFFTLKVIQLGKYMNAMTVNVPKEEMLAKIPNYNTNIDTEAFHKFLDEMERLKLERKNLNLKNKEL